jgi:hypothetical protein
MKCKLAVKENYDKNDWQKCYDFTQYSLFPLNISVEWHVDKQQNMLQ